MEMLSSAILGDLVSRSISLVIEKYWQHKAGVQENPQRLHQMLQRIQTTVLEAEGRLITNQGMLQQVQVMREEMYKGYYMFDTFTYRAHKENTKDEVSHSYALSRFTVAKRHCFSIRNTQSLAVGSYSTSELQEMLDRLERMVVDMEEFILFLKSYPCMYRQVYSTYLLLDKCMFGRQIEREQIINFLLETDLPGTRNVGVLPIIGTARIGKSTLVENVCYDERVQDHFSSIVLFTGNSLEDKTLYSLRDCGVLKHQSHDSHDRTLIIIELIGDVDEGEWRRLYSSGNHITRGSKIIITSRSETIANFGTTQALKLKSLSREARWYFFKVAAFGSTNPAEHPKLTSIAMEIAENMGGSFLGIHTIGGLLRANLNIQFWWKFLRSFREYIQNHLLLFGEHPVDLIRKNRPIYLFKVDTTSKDCFACNYYQTSSSQHKIPNITIQAVISGVAKLHEKFEALEWRSQIPPYYNYLMSVASHRPQNMMVTKKRHRQTPT